MSTEITASPLNIPMIWTEFASKDAASQMTRRVGNWRDIVNDAKHPKTFSKRELAPLQSFSEYGDVGNDKGNLRHAENLGLFSAVCLDYDAGEIPPLVTVERLRIHGIEALVRTTGRHDEAAPRYRVIAPLTNRCSGTEIIELMAQLNFAVGGIAASESFTPSQCWFFGKVQGVPYEYHHCSGHALDDGPSLFLDTDYGPKGKPASSTHAIVGVTEPESVDSMEDLALPLTPKELHLVASAVTAMAPARAGRYLDGWLQVLQNLKHVASRGHADFAKKLAWEFSKKCPEKVNAVDFEAKWERGLHKTRGGFATLFHLAQQDGWDHAKASTEWDTDNAVAGFPDLPALVEPLPAFNRRKSGEVPPITGNVTRALEHSVVCGYQLRFDKFGSETMIAPAETENWKAWQDTDYVRLQLRLEAFGFAHIGDSILRAAVHYVAEKNSFDSAAHWLSSLQWDGVSRVESFLPAYFGTADTPYTRAVGQYLWSALAGRVLCPGVKADMVPVAVGAQGARKSTAVAAMAPAPEHFMEADLSRSDDDQARLMRGKLVIELAELNGLRTREAEHIKAFVSRTHEHWTPKYMETSTTYARRGVFFGTSNRDDFLADDTGNRRWLPFNCGQCDPDAITRDRAQLWAEASGLYKSQGVMHRAAESLAVVELGQFAAHDDWDTTVQTWMSRSDFDDVKNGDLPYLTSEKVLRDCFGFAPGQQSPLLQKRVKSVLIRLGYTYTQRRIDGQKARVFDAPSLF